MKKLFASIVLSAVTSMALANPVTVKGDEGTYTVPMSMAGTNAPVHWDEGHAIFCDAYPPQPGRHGSLPFMDCTSGLPHTDVLLFSCRPRAAGEWDGYCELDGKEYAEETMYEAAYFLIPREATLEWDDGLFKAVIPPKNLTYNPFTATPVYQEAVPTTHDPRPVRWDELEEMKE